MGSPFLLQGIFPTEGSNPGLLITGRFFTSWATREALKPRGRSQTFGDIKLVESWESVFKKKKTKLDAKVNVCVQWENKITSYKSQKGINYHGYHKTLENNTKFVLINCRRLLYNIYFPPSVFACMHFDLLCNIFWRKRVLFLAEDLRCGSPPPTSIDSDLGDKPGCGQCWCRPRDL